MMKKIYKFGYTFLCTGIICWSVIASLGQSQTGMPDNIKPSKQPQSVLIRELAKNSEKYLNTVITQGRIVNVNYSKKIFILADINETSKPVMLPVLTNDPLPNKGDIVEVTGKICYSISELSETEFFFRAISIKQLAKE